MVSSNFKALIGTLRRTFSLRNTGEAILLTTSLASAVAGVVCLIIKNATPIWSEFQITNLSQSNESKEHEPYIYIENSSNSADGEDSVDNKDGSFDITRHKGGTGNNTQHEISVNAARWYHRFRAHQSHDARTLLKLSRSNDDRVCAAAVVSMVTEPWTDADYVTLSQALDMATMITLARHPDADVRFFRPSPYLVGVERTVSKREDLKRILGSLPTNDIDADTKHLAANALAVGVHSAKSGIGDAWCFGGVGLPLAESHIDVPAETLEMIYLEALASHSTIPSHCQQIVRDGGLHVLQRIYLKRQSNLKIMRLVFRIVANMSFSEELHGDLYTSGWISNLARCFQHEDLELSTQASRGLYNLDRNNEQYKLDDGVFIFHPQHRSIEPIIADVVFIHGLRGSAFKTWRQADLATVSSNSEEEVEKQKTYVKDYTSSWPKDWLTKQIPNLRILTVEFDTYLSEWDTQYEPEKRSLKARSSDMLAKLQRAGVGSRPVVFVGHSMGGLMIKEMLVNNSELSGQVLGCIFYSTPHYGSPLAASYSQAISRILLHPTQEVTELRTDAPSLVSLNKDFHELCNETKMQCLSFGESEKTAVGLNMKLTVVPPESSNPGFGHFILLECSHLDVCKPQNKDSVVYQKSKDYIANCLKRNADSETEAYYKYRDESYFLY